MGAGGAMVWPGRDVAMTKRQCVEWQWGKTRNGAVRLMGGEVAMAR